LLPARIEQLEGDMVKLESAGRSGALHQRSKAVCPITAALDKARAEKEAAEERWLELAEMVEG
jgi:ATP-binding cassette subfamily F protein uup